MKKVKGILLMLIIAVIFSIALQSITLFFIQSHYVDSELEVSFTNVTEEKNTEEKQEVKIPEGSNIISVSNKGKYLLYELNSEAYILNIDNGNEHKIGINVDSDTFFKWNDTEEKLIISRTLHTDKIGFEILLYNPNNNFLQEALDANNNHNIYALFNLSEKITDIKLNNVNTIIYIKVDDGTNEWINRLDISGQTNKLYLNTNKLGKYEVINTSDEIIYEDKTNGTLAYMSNNNISEFKPNGLLKGKLLGSYNNVFYVGEGEDDSISKIYYRDLSDGYKESDKWNEKQFSTSYKEDSLVISNSNNIYFIDKEKNIITNINSEKKDNYEGEFVTIVDDKVISNLNNVIKVMDLR